MAWDKAGDRQLSGPGPHLPAPAFISQNWPIQSQKEPGRTVGKPRLREGASCSRSHSSLRRDRNKPGLLGPGLDLLWPSLCSENKLLYWVQSLTQANGMIMGVFQPKTPEFSSMVRSLTKHGTGAWRSVLTLLPTAWHPPYPSRLLLSLYLQSWALESKGPSSNAHSFTYWLSG